MIDYLTFVTDVSQGNPGLPNHPMFAPARRGEKLDKRYIAAHETKSDALIQLFEYGEKSYIMFNSGGTSLERARTTYNVSDEDIIAMLNEHAISTENFNLTRIDYALDTDDSAARVADIWNFYLRAGAVGNFSDVSRQLSGKSAAGGLKVGETVYLGSPKSDRRVRIYDKAMQMDILYDAWTRVELQQRKRGSASLMSDMHAHGCERAVKAVLRRSIKSTVKWLDTLLLDKTVPYRRKESKPDRWENWMSEQVLHSMRNHMASHFQFLENFLGEFAEDMLRFSEANEVWE